MVTCESGFWVVLMFVVSGVMIRVLRSVDWGYEEILEEEKEELRVLRLVRIGSGWEVLMDVVLGA